MRVQARQGIDGCHVYIAAAHGQKLGVCCCKGTDAQLGFSPLKFLPPQATAHMTLAPLYVAHHASNHYTGGYSILGCRRDAIASHHSFSRPLAYHFSHRHQQAMGSAITTWPSANRLLDHHADGHQQQPNTNREAVKSAITHPLVIVIIALTAAIQLAALRLRSRLPLLLPLPCRLPLRRTPLPLPLPGAGPLSATRLPFCCLPCPSSTTPLGPLAFSSSCFLRPRSRLPLGPLLLFHAALGPQPPPCTDRLWRFPACRRCFAARRASLPLALPLPFGTPLTFVCEESVRRGYQEEIVRM